MAEGLGKNDGLIEEQYSFTPYRKDIEAPAREGFFSMPSSAATYATMKILGAQGDLKEMAVRNNSAPSTHGLKIYYGEKGDSRKLSFKRGGNEYIFEIDDIKTLSGYNKSVKKIFAYTLTKINQQAYSDGLFKRGHVSFPLQELVDVGIYKKIRAARAGYDDAMKALTSIKLGGKVKRGKKETKVTSGKAGIEVIFPGAHIENGICYVYLNERISWELIAAFYTRIPAFYFQLPSKAADLLFYIFYLARQNIEKIKEKGYFDINLRSIAQFLGLPRETEAKNPTDAIKNKIEEAIKDIEAKLEESTEKGAFTITPYYKERASITEYLDNGYIRVVLFGSYASYFVEIADKKTKGLEAARRKKERVEIAVKAKIAENKEKAKAKEEKEKADKKKAKEEPEAKAEE